MRIVWILGPLAMLLAATSAVAGPPRFEICCACVTDPPATSSAPAPPPSQEALFCRLITSSSAEDAFNAQCHAAGATGVCSANAMASIEDNLNCTEELAGAGIVCPPARPVPTAAHPALLGLATLLAGLGAWAAGRRVRG